MSKVFRPRRGRKSLMAGYKAGALILEEGEMFIEYPDEGVGKSTLGTGVGIKIGDGNTRYSELPYYLHEQDITPIIEELRQEIEQKKVEITVIVDQKSDQMDRKFEQMVAQMNQVKAECLAAIETAKAEINVNAINTKINNLQTQVNSKVATSTYNAGVNNLQSQINKKAYNSDLERVVSNLNSSIQWRYDVLSGRCDSLQEDVDDLWDAVF